MFKNRNLLIGTLITAVIMYVFSSIVLAKPMENLDDIDQLKQYENMDKVMISGLHQDSFEYFINHYICL